MDRSAEIGYFLHRVENASETSRNSREAAMRQRQISLIASVFGGAFLQACLPGAAAHAQSAAALSGQVTSSDEGPMEGVLVSARRDGSSITTTVVSDDRGRYAFPAARLEPGRYTIAIRAVGYKLDAPKSVDVQAGATADLTLGKSKNVASQLSS